MGRLMKIASVVFITVLAQLLVSPAHAHLPDYGEPPHGIWVAGFVGDEPTVGNRESVQLTAYSRFTPSAPLPPPLFAKFFVREYDFLLPHGSTVTYASIDSGECSNNGNTVHCEARFGLHADTGDVVTIVLTMPDVADGSYPASMSTTAYIDGQPYTDSDSISINVRARRTADIAVTGPVPNTPVEAGKPTTLTYTVTNNGPEDAREVSETFEVYVSGSGTALTPATEECVGDDYRHQRIECRWPLIPAGGSRPIVFSVTYDPGAPEVNGQLQLYFEGYSYEEDPVLENHQIISVIPTHCSYFVDSSSTVDPTASIARSGCTYVRESVIGARAELGKASAVTDAVIRQRAKIGSNAALYLADIGPDATIGPGSVYQSGTMGAKGKLGKASVFGGDIGDKAAVGDGVQMGRDRAKGVIVGAGATVGSGTWIDVLGENWYEQIVNILPGATVPNNTSITLDYCRENPKICSIYASP